MEVTTFRIEDLFSDQETQRVDWTEDQYLKYTKALGSSQIREFLYSPNAFRQTVIDQEPKEEKDSFRYGRAVHCFLLEPEKFESTYMFLPTAEKLGFKDFRTKAAQEKRDAYYKEAEEKKRILLTEKELNDIKTIARNIERHEDGKNLIKYGEPEVTILFKDPITRINLKVRIDILAFAGELVNEIKTTTNAKRKPFGCEIYRRRYDVQIALQMMGVDMLTGKMPTMNSIMAIGKEKKEIGVFNFVPRQIENAWSAIRCALDGIKYCIDTNDWPMAQKQAEEVYEPKNYQDESVDADAAEAFEAMEAV